jgi:hypothetical protein
LIGAASFFFNEKRRLEHNLEKFSKSIILKLEANIPLSVRDVNAIARGSKITRDSALKCVSNLLRDTTEPALFAKLSELYGDLEKTEPFEDLPPEVKPSLTRIQELIESSNQRSDVLLLSPIQRALGAYVEQKTEFESSKRLSKWLNLLTIIGFVVGLWGFYFSWKSPDLKDIETVVTKAVRQPSDPAIKSGEAK